MPDGVDCLPLWTTRPRHLDCELHDDSAADLQVAGAAVPPKARKWCRAERQGICREVAGFTSLSTPGHTGGAGPAGRTGGGRSKGVIAMANPNRIDAPQPEPVPERDVLAMLAMLDYL